MWVVGIHTETKGNIEMFEQQILKFLWNTNTKRFVSITQSFFEKFFMYDSWVWSSSQRSPCEVSRHLTELWSRLRSPSILFSTQDMRFAQAWDDTMHLTSLDRGLIAFFKATPLFLTLKPADQASLKQWDEV